MTITAPAVSPAARESPPVLSIRGLTKRFGAVVAVDHLDLDAAPGEVLGLLGPNGSGKSTTLNVALGFLFPTSGRVVIAGHDLARDRTRALRHVGGLVEGSGFYPYLSGRDNLALLATIQGIAPDRIDAVLEMVDLVSAASRRFGGYSQGMRRRLGVAAALLHRPRLVVLDEPTSGLDPAGTREMRALLPRLAAEGATVVLASHLLGEVQQVCDRVAIMQSGRIIARGRVADLLRGEGRWRVRVAADQRAAACALLDRAFPAARVTAEGADLTLAPQGGGADVNRVLAGAGIFASEIAPLSSTLESVFLDLTGAEPAP